MLALPTSRNLVDSYAMLLVCLCRGLLSLAEAMEAKEVLTSARAPAEQFREQRKRRSAFRHERLKSRKPVSGRRPGSDMRC